MSTIHPREQDWINSDKDIATVLSSLSPLATMVLAFYFANNAAQQTQAAASA